MEEAELYLGLKESRMWRIDLMTLHLTITVLKIVLVSMST